MTTHAAGTPGEETEMNTTTVGQTALADLIRDGREAARMTQRDVADQVGVHYATISKIESGDEVPSVTLTAQLATALGLDVYRCLFARWMHFADRFARDVAELGYTLEWRDTGGVYLVQAGTPGEGDQS